MEAKSHHRIQETEPEVVVGTIREVISANWSSSKRWIDIITLWESLNLVSCCCAVMTLISLLEKQPILELL